jgi:ubiquinone/menaquinone biosynthesis C-methylase UbiE
MDTKPWSGFRAWLYSLIFRSPKSNRLIVELAGLTSTDRTLDIGCGPGAAVRFAADIVVDGAAMGVDRAQAMVDIARRRSRSYANTAFEVGAAEALPFEDGSFTVAWTAHSFHHWEDRRAGIAEMYRVLNRGGRAFILEQDGKTHGLSAEEAERVAVDLEQVGFRSIDISRHDDQVVITARTEPAR